MEITVPAFALLVLISQSDQARAAFASRHFRPAEVLTLAVQHSPPKEAQSSARYFNPHVLFAAARGRLAARQLTVVDAPNLDPAARWPLLKLAHRFHAPALAIGLDVGARRDDETGRARTVGIPPSVSLAKHSEQSRRFLPELQQEGFAQVVVLRSFEEIDTSTLLRTPLLVDRHTDHGPFDLIGDLHGCLVELTDLLKLLGYQQPAPGCAYMHPVGRRAIFLGDLVDRGPDSPGVLRLVMAMVAAGSALCLPGNHDDRLLRRLRGRNTQLEHGLAETLAQLAVEPLAFREQVMTFLGSLPSHYLLDDGRLVVAHAGMKRSLQGRDSPRVRNFALYGQTTGALDELGLPVRIDWAGEYRGRALVVYGHTPVAEPAWVNNTICIDTGCVFGGQLTALRYPECQLVAVPARRAYATPARPFPPKH